MIFKSSASVMIYCMISVMNGECRLQGAHRRAQPRGAGHEDLAQVEGAQPGFQGSHVQEEVWQHRNAQHKAGGP
jgi:hypothetical protein